MKKILKLPLILIVIIALTGCGSGKVEEKQGEEVAKTDIKNNESTEPEQKQEEIEEIKDGRSVDGLKESFKDNGFILGDNQVVAFEMLEADNGMKFTLDEELIEIYEYDLESLTSEAREVVDQAAKGSVDMSGFNIPVVYKDGLMLTRHDEHTQQEKILEIFNDY